METYQAKIRFVDVILFLIFLLLLALPGYLCYEVLIQSKVSNTQSNAEETETTQGQEETNTPTQEVVKEPTYTEFVREIGGQATYIAVPDNVDPNDPPSVILYSHGSDVGVISDMYDPNMMDMADYGKFFALKNYIFAASNEHGANWGSTASVDDMNTLLEWIRNNYVTSRAVYLIGHSMGGLPTMHFALQYPEDILKIALLAPTVRTYEWPQDKVDIIKDIDIKIWHGTKDVNIGIVNSREFVQYMQSKGKTIPLVELEDKNHTDVKTGYKDQIYQFFESAN